MALVTRVSYRGGDLDIPPSHNFPYPEILKLSMVIIIAIYTLYFVRFAACATGKYSFLHYITAIL